MTTWKMPMTTSKYLLTKTYNRNVISSDLLPSDNDKNLNWGLRT